MSKKMKNIAQSEVLTLREQISYQEGQVVSKTLTQNQAVSITLFSFAKGEEISTHESGGDAFVTCLDGPLNLLAIILTPAPVPQITIPRSALPSRITRARFSDASKYRVASSSFCAPTSSTSYPRAMMCAFTASFKRNPEKSDAITTFISVFLSYLFRIRTPTYG